MAGSPRYKVYSADNDYRGSLKDPSEAAAVVSLLGPGATIRDGHSKSDTVWTEGVDGLAADSYDAVAEAVFSRRS